MLHNVSFYGCTDNYKGGIPDIVIFANVHSDSDHEVIQKALDVLKPNTVWTEGHYDEPPVASFPTIGWDDQDHCRQIREEPSSEKKLDISRANDESRHARLCDVVSKFYPGDVVLVGRAHAVYPSPYQSDVWPTDKEHVRAFHRALKERGLSAVILTCGGWGSVDLEKSVPLPSQSIHEIKKGQFGPTFGDRVHGILKWANLVR